MNGYNPAMNSRPKSLFSGLLRPFVASFFLTAFASALPAQALEKDAFFYLIDAQLLGGYSEVTGNDGILSTDDQWSISPNLTLIKDTLYWINLYTGSYNRASQVVAQEEGGRSTESTMSHSLTTALKYNVSKTWMLRPLFFADWVFVNEAANENFGEGLYDYRDIGGGLESAWVTMETKTQLNEVRAGYRYFDREYPNYESLLSQFDPRAQVNEQREKDFQGHKVNLSYEAQNREGWSWGAEGVLLYKDYDDKRTIDRNGIRSLDDRRQEYQEIVNVYAAHLVCPNWTFRLDGQVTVNTGNLDFYDTHNTATLSDDDFIPDYFDYVSFLTRPSLTYQREIAEGKNLIASAAYGFSAQYYLGRRVQNISGNYQSDEEEDFAHSFSGHLSVPLTKYVSWVTVANYTIVDSNQKYEAFYLYTYDTWSAMTGFSLKY